MILIEASAGDYLDGARQLFRQYAADLGVDLGFQQFDRELASLPGAYAPPGGRLLLALEGSDMLGCGALRPLGAGACEMKRLYVRPGARGRGVGRAIALRLIAEAQAIGYRSMLLDTLQTMGEALTLYAGLGFERRAPYYQTPLAGTVFMEKAL